MKAENPALGSTNWKVRSASEGGSMCEIPDLIQLQDNHQGWFVVLHIPSANPPSPTNTNPQHLCYPRPIGPSAIYLLTLQAAILIRPISAVIKEVAAKLSLYAFPILAVKLILLMAATPGHGGW